MGSWTWGWLCLYRRELGHVKGAVPSWPPLTLQGLVLLSPALPTCRTDKLLPVFSRVWWAQSMPVEHCECGNTAQSLAGSYVGQPAQRRALTALSENCGQVMSCKNVPRNLGSQGREGFSLHYTFKMTLYPQSDVGKAGSQVDTDFKSL